MSVHVIGGGVAGLAAAIGCVERGLNVTLYEAAPQLGGRCRSYHHNEFDGELDNGAHAVLANNVAVNRYLNLIGAADRLQTHGRDGLSFVDVRDGAAWRLRLPQGLWDSAARPPGVSAWDLANGARLFWGQTEFKASAVATEKLWEPLCTSALNTPLMESDAGLLSVVLRGMAGVGGLRQGLKLPHHSLTHSYIDPAAQWLQRQGATIRLQSPLRDITQTARRIEQLSFDQGVIAVEAGDCVIIAVPPWSPLMERLGIKTEHLRPSPILNVHFRNQTTQAPNFIGLVGGHSQWLWLRNGLVTVTISAADADMNADSDDLAGLVWAEIAPVLGEDAARIPQFHVVKERRATIRHGVGINALRPLARTHIANLILAGDWVNTGLPCTLESAIQSGFGAAQLT